MKTYMAKAGSVEKKWYVVDATGKTMGLSLIHIQMCIRDRIECVEHSEEGRYAKFVKDPLERGFGMTLGNSLRRVLLSCLPGVAATKVKIDGVLHEFSTIPGVHEDVTNIVLNLKGLCTKLHTDEPKVVTIDAVGPTEAVSYTHLDVYKRQD